MTSQLLLNEMIETVKINICKKLGHQIAYRNTSFWMDATFAPISWFCEKPKFLSISHKGKRLRLYYYLESLGRHATTKADIIVTTVDGIDPSTAISLQIPRVVEVVP